MNAPCVARYQLASESKRFQANSCLLRPFRRILSLASEFLVSPRSGWKYRTLAPRKRVKLASSQKSEARRLSENEKDSTLSLDMEPSLRTATTKKAHRTLPFFFDTLVPTGALYTSEYGKVRQSCCLLVVFGMEISKSNGDRRSPKVIKETRRFGKEERETGVTVSRSLACNGRKKEKGKRKRRGLLLVTSIEASRAGYW